MKIVVSLMGLALVAGLVACGGEESQPAAPQGLRLPVEEMPAATEVEAAASEAEEAVEETVESTPEMAPAETEEIQEDLEGMATGIDPSQGAEPAPMPAEGAIAPPNPEAPPGQELPARP